MSYTKVNVRKELIEQVKVKATSDNRSITNYIETLILKDLYVTAPNKQEAYDRAVHESSEVAKGGIAKLSEVNIVREK